MVNTEIKLIIFFVAEDGAALQSQKKTRPGADCGSDHEFLIARFRLKLKKVGKTTRPFRYDLNQIPYDYTVEVRNRFKGLDLIDRAPDELCFGKWTATYKQNHPVHTLIPSPPIFIKCLWINKKLPG